MVGRDNAQGQKKEGFFNSLVIYTCWNLWKERNQRIFNNAQESALQVASRIKENIAQRKRALDRERLASWGSCCSCTSVCFFSPPLPPLSAELRPVHKPLFSFLN